MMFTQLLKRFANLKFLALLIITALFPLNTAFAGETAIVILAAGFGRRMESEEIPKVLHKIQERPMIFYILDAIKNASPAAPIAVVVGYKKELVVSYVLGEPAFKGLNIDFVIQPEQLGTGHAARCAMDSDWGAERLARKDAVLVLPGDMPLITAQMIGDMVTPLEAGVQMKLMTTILEKPTGYGRIVRDKHDRVVRIVEEKDADADQKLIREVGVSIYTFASAFLQTGLHGLKTENAQKEFYLTDLVALATSQNAEVPVLIWKNPDDLRGVNTFAELQEATRLMVLRSDEIGRIRPLISPIDLIKNGLFQSGGGGNDSL